MVIVSHGVSTTSGGLLVIDGTEILSQDDFDQLSTTKLQAEAVILVNCWSGAVEAWADFRAREVRGVAPALLGSRHPNSCRDDLASDHPTATSWINAFFNALAAGKDIGEACRHAQQPHQQQKAPDHRDPSPSGPTCRPPEMLWWT